METDKLIYEVHGDYLNLSKKRAQLVNSINSMLDGDVVCTGLNLKKNQVCIHFSGDVDIDFLERFKEKYNLNVVYVRAVEDYCIYLIIPLGV